MRLSFVLALVAALTVSTSVSADENCPDFCDNDADCLGCPTYETCIAVYYPLTVKRLVLGVGTTTTNEDIETEVDLYDDTSFDDTNVPCAVVIADMVGAGVAAGIERVDRRLGSKTDAESLEFEGNNHSEGSADVAEELGRGRRNKKANTLYSHTFWRHHDDGET
ncbi:hypothetical protein DEU56DRAFT_950210 [Suillus clintonianus]|uniref:uncharacterized protein n=1 Tax=Suillus clintonianus TaxID=1904413 RepID=UPI001B85F35F|nr:uncharacterized protein DEU56DRAFT_950210 [Suillus clintonianus]KAG2134079.1 hypothetical protein DEU56DRAFT_950210 [Suillus clintonianus]